jgi:hypothetical protein
MYIKVYCNEAPKTALRTYGQSPAGARALDRPRYTDAFALPPAPRETDAASEPYARSRVAGMPATDRSRRLPEHPRHLGIRVYKAAAAERRGSLSFRSASAREATQVVRESSELGFRQEILVADRPRSYSRCSVGSSELGLRRAILAGRSAIFRSASGINRHAP